MTRYSFTGPTDLTTHARVKATVAVRSLHEPTEITTGGARGWDVACALDAIQAFPGAVHRIVLPAAPYDHRGVAAVEALAREHGVVDFRIVNVAGRPGASLSDRYRARNEMLVFHADVLVSGSYGPAFYRSGEWMTINIARKVAVRVDLHDLTTVACYL